MACGERIGSANGVRLRFRREGRQFLARRGGDPVHSAPSRLLHHDRRGDRHRGHHALRRRDPRVRGPAPKRLVLRRIPGPEGVVRGVRLCLGRRRRDRGVARDRVHAHGPPRPASGDPGGGRRRAGGHQHPGRQRLSRSATLPRSESDKRSAMNRLASIATAIVLGVGAGTGIAACGGGGTTTVTQTQAPAPTPTTTTKPTTSTSTTSTTSSTTSTKEDNGGGKGGSGNGGTGSG